MYHRTFNLTKSLAASLSPTTKIAFPPVPSSSVYKKVCWSSNNNHTTTNNMSSTNSYKRSIITTTATRTLERKGIRRRQENTILGEKI
jgi:hypothetical protein